MKVEDLEGAELDCFVATAIGLEAEVTEGFPGSKSVACWVHDEDHEDGIKTGTFNPDFRPSKRWQDGGPLIEEYIKGFRTGGTVADEGVRYAVIDGPMGDLKQPGNNYLEATCRAIVASVYGNEVEVNNG